MPSQDPTANPLTVVWEARPANLVPRVIRSWSIDTSYLTSTDEWSMVVFDTDKARLRNLHLEPISLLVDGNPQLIGHVERISRGQDGSVTISGRDYLAQLVECNVDPTVAVKADMDLGSALSEILAPCGITAIGSDGDLNMRSLRTGKDPGGNGPDFKSFKPGELKPESGMGCYDFANRIVARLGATIQPANARDTIWVTTPSYTQSAQATLVRTDDPAGAALNNVIAATSEEDLSRFPTAALSSGKITKSGEAAQAKSYEYSLIDSIEAGGAASLAAAIKDKIITTRLTPKSNTGKSNGTKVYRFLYLKDDEARSLEQITKGLSRAVCERLKDSLVYSATMKGFSDWHTGAVYSVDSRVRVEDDICDIHETLWVASRKFSYAEGRGTTTMLECWRPGAFSINPG
jgi:prophage tail gpP-like protein